jgi:hypothetical protein
MSPRISPVVTPNKMRGTSSSERPVKILSTAGATWAL